jgi:drug/metabolite transporter (DMT)-like permease
MTIASFFFWGGCLFKGNHPFRRFTRKDLLTAIGSGVFLTIHFATWITSLKYTTVANSVLLVTTSAIFVTIGSVVFYHVRPSRTLLAGVLITMFGAMITATRIPDTGNSSLYGNFLALCGAVSAAGYLLLGRQLRSRMDTLSYVTIVYSSTAVFLVIMTLVIDDPLTGYSNNIYLLLFLIALIPQVIGHTSYNWSLKHFSAETVAVVTLGEPVGASVLAYFLLDEHISSMQFLGGLLILAGVALTLLSETSLLIKKQKTSSGFVD